MRQIITGVVIVFKMMTLAVALATMVTTTKASADVLYESGALGPTGVPFTDLVGGIVPGTNINAFVFPGVRFELNEPAITTQIGGHFVAPISGTFFGAIIALEDENDFPDSIDLTSPDVVGSTLLTLPILSDEVFGDLSLSLDPGWYALVFGSGLFGAGSYGGAVRDGLDIGDPSYIAFDPNLDWFNLNIFQTFFDNHRFVVKGSIVPEPNTLCLTVLIVSSTFLYGQTRFRSMFHQ